MVLLEAHNRTGKKIWLHTAKTPSKTSSSCPFWQLSSELEESPWSISAMLAITALHSMALPFWTVRKLVKVNFLFLMRAVTVHEKSTNWYPNLNRYSITFQPFQILRLAKQRAKRSFWPLEERPVRMGLRQIHKLPALLIPFGIFSVVVAATLVHLVMLLSMASIWILKVVLQLATLPWSSNCARISVSYNE